MEHRTVHDDDRRGGGEVWGVYQKGSPHVA